MLTLPTIVVKYAKSTDSEIHVCIFQTLIKLYSFISSLLEYLTVSIFMLHKSKHKYLHS